MFVNVSRVFVISVVGAKEDKSTNIVMGQIARVAFSLGGKGGGLMSEATSADYFVLYNYLYEFLKIAG